MKFKCQDTALENPNNTVRGELRRGQTCTFEEPVVVPACTHLFLKGGDGGAPAGEAIISGNHKTQHFRVNGKLTLQDLVLEKGRGTFGGALQVQGLFAQAHLIDTTIRESRAREPYSKRILHQSGGGAIFVSVGVGQPRKLLRGINDHVRLILEGNTRIVNNTANAGKL